MGSPLELVGKHCPQRTVVFSCDHGGVAEMVERRPSVEAVRRDALTYSVSGSGPDFVSEMIRFISEESIRVTDFRTVEPTLEDVFLKLTGHGIRD